MLIRRKFVQSIAWAFSLAPAISLVKADEAADDLKKLQGKWTSTSQEPDDSTWTFTGDKLILKAPGRSYTIVVKLDPSTKPHKSMDMNTTGDSDNAKNFKGKAIYRFVGDDKVSICFGINDRPTEFKPKEDFTAFVFGLTRKK